jgi:ubiquinone/menaquinone biosynthesis C-methylase UbiE
MENSQRNKATLALPARLVRRSLGLFFRLLYHEFAWTYDFVAAAVSLGLWKQWVLAVLPYIKGPRVLELGYGPGHLQAALAHREINAVGLDESRQMAGRVVRKMRKLGYPYRLVNGYAQNLPFVDACFDQVVATFPTDYIVHPHTLEEIRRLLVPGGSLLVLPFAWITGKGIFHRLAAGLFRFTGEAPDWDGAFLEPFRRAGFDARLEQHTLPNSRLVIIRALKPMD